MPYNQSDRGPMVVIAGNFTYPFGSASASRLRNLALGLAEVGAAVHIISMLPPSPAPERHSSQWSHNRITYEFSNSGRIATKSSPALMPGNRLLQKLAWLRSLHHAVHPTKQTVQRLILDGRCDLFIGYFRMISLIWPLIELCRREGVTTIVDAVEMPGSCTGIGGRLSPIWLEEKLGSAYVVKHSDGLTTITTILQKYYERRGAKRTLVLPSLAEGRGFPDPDPPESRQPYTFAHVGALSDRDNPKLMFESLRELHNAGSNIRLKVFGRFLAQRSGARWPEYCRRDSSLKKIVEFVGELGDDDLRKQVSKADALILMRRDALSERASFPTRLVEYLEYGLPVFVSAVGDIPRYLENDISAILLRGTPRETARSIQSVITRTDRGRSIGLRGRQCCQSCFNRTVHARRLLEFAESLRPSR